MMFKTFSAFNSLVKAKAIPTNGLGQKERPRRSTESLLNQRMLHPMANILHYSWPHTLYIFSYYTYAKSKKDVMSNFYLPL